MTPEWELVNTLRDVNVRLKAEKEAAEAALRESRARVEQADVLIDSVMGEMSRDAIFTRQPEWLRRLKVARAALASPAEATAPTNSIQPAGDAVQDLKRAAWKRSKRETEAAEKRLRDLMEGKGKIHTCPICGPECSC